MDRRDAWQAGEVRYVERQDLSQSIREEYGCQASIVRTLASYFSAYDQGEPAFKGIGSFIEQRELASQKFDRIGGLAGRPTEAVHVDRPSCHDPKLGQHLRREH
jgi:hypothetical protein